MRAERRRFGANVNVSEELFTQMDEEIHIQGNCKLSGFQNSGQIVIGGKVVKCNFDEVSRSVTIGKNAKKCVFNRCKFVIINGLAKNCVFVNMDKRSIFIKEGRGCRLNNEPFVVIPPSAPRVFSSSLSIGWGNINIKGGPTVMRGSTIEISGTGTIQNIPVTAGRYTKRAGDNMTLYRQDLSASPTNDASWQMYDTDAKAWVPAVRN